MDVLVVEDDRSNLDLMLRRLARNGIAALSAENSQDALKMIREECPLVVLLDIGLPDESGIETLRSIKRDPATSHVHVVVTTSDSGARGACEDAGADAFLLKPIDTAFLCALMERFGIRSRRGEAAH
jgi:CheY-like chemotaxis protein